MVNCNGEDCILGSGDICMLEVNTLSTTVVVAVDDDIMVAGTMYVATSGA